MNARKSLEPSVYLVTDPFLLAGRDIVEVVRRALSGGVTIVQLRDKTADDETLLRQGEALQRLCDDFGAMFILNDRPDLAARSGADGVHIGQGDVTLAEARALVGPQSVIGVSVGTVEEAIVAQQGGADYLGVSPIFATPTKTDAPTATGLAGLAAIRQAVALPLVAIGGVDEHTAPQVLQAGADGLAVVRAILADDTPERAARRLATLVGEFRRNKMPQAE